MINIRKINTRMINPHSINFQIALKNLKEPKNYRQGMNGDARNVKISSWPLNR